jgi:DNA repair exonuclease SbcCD nuclease subunit
VDKVVLAGDTFDKSRPNLEEIHLLQTFCDRIKCPILIIDGNHEAIGNTGKTTFDCLRFDSASFEPLVRHDNVTFVGWSRRDCLADLAPNDVLISHLRANHGPYIKEEVDFSAFKDNFKLIILGDIHTECRPYPNVVYTTSPYSINFENYTKPPDHGYGIVTVGEELKYEYRKVKLPSKYKLETTTKSLPKVLETLDKQHKYRITVVGLPSELIGVQDTELITYVKTALVVEQENVLDIDTDIHIVTRVLDSTCTTNSFSNTERATLKKLLQEAT